MPHADSNVQLLGVGAARFAPEAAHNNATWFALRKCQEAVPTNKFGPWKCHGAAYDEYLSRLPPAPTAAQLTFPPGKKIFMYGMSYLQNTLFAALATCAIDFKTATNFTSECELLGEGAACEARLDAMWADVRSANGNTTSKFGTLSREAYREPPNSLVRVQLPHMTSVVMASNRGVMQLEPAVPTVLRAVLRAQKFDAAVVMQPHPDCFLMHGYKPPNTSKRCWVSLKPNETVARDFTKRAAIRREFSAALGTRWVEVIPWTAPPPRKGVDEPPPHVRVIDPAVMRRFPCSDIGGCRHGLGGHQCAPGATTMLAAHVVAAVNSIFERGSYYRS